MESARNNAWLHELILWIDYCVAINQSLIVLFEAEQKNVYDADISTVDFFNLWDLSAATQVEDLF